jgi:CheY-like chemotaxis protein
MAQHVLVVDDDQVCAEAIALLLRNAGYRVSAANHFTEALAILESVPPPDLLICDIVMPNSINGIALGRMGRLRNINLRVIYITGFDVSHLEPELAGPLMRKPLADEELLATVAAELARQERSDCSPL